MSSTRKSDDASHVQRPPPLEVTFEFARADAAGDPFAFRFSEQTYTIREDSGSYESAVLPWDEEMLEDIERIQRPRPDRGAMQRMGDKLRMFLATPSFGEREARIEDALKERRPVRITVRSAAAELYALPWELVTRRSTGQHIGEIDDVLLRYEWPGTKARERDPDPPIAGGPVLFAWSSAGGAVPAAEHLDAIRSAARRGFYPFDEDACVIPHASLRSIREALTAAEHPAVLHILCHGGKTDSDMPVIGLALDPSRRGDPSDVIDPGALRQALEPFASSLRLVVLAACQGSDPGALGNHLGSVAQALHRVGIPAVVASRYPLSVDGSIVMAKALYNELFVSLGSLESAFLSARKSLADQPERLDWAALQMYCHAPSGPDTRPIVVRPYRGLRPFNPEDRRLFFGRRRQVERLLDVMRGGQRLLALIGASGSGKSSLVMAGMIPEIMGGALDRGPGASPGAGPGAKEPSDARDPRDPRDARNAKASKDAKGAAQARPFRIALIRPGAKPCSALADALTTLASPDGEIRSRRGAGGMEARDELRKSPTALLSLVEAAVSGLAGQPRLLVVVDQFEEIFTQSDDHAEAAAFVANLLHATSAPGDAVWVILTLRADFLSNCLLFDRDLADRLGKVMEIILPMSEEEVRQTIERPAEALGLAFEPGLVDALLGAVRDDLASARDGGGGTGGSSSDANLPLLQFALDALWEHRSGHFMTFEGFRAIGGLKGALTRKAEEMLLASRDEAERALVKSIFRQLVLVREGMADTRRYASRSALAALSEGKVEPILERWIESRLLTADETEVWVAHEALIREWSTLRAWIDESRDLLRIRQEIEHETRHWVEGGKAEDDLLRGMRLHRAMVLVEDDLLALSGDEQDFLDASYMHERKAIEEAKAQEELALTEELERQRREMRSSRRIAAGALALSLATAAIAAWAVTEMREAHRAKSDAEAATLAAKRAHREATIAGQISGARELILRGQPAVASKLLAAANEAHEADNFGEVAVDVLKRSMPWRTLSGHKSALTFVAVSPDGKRIVTTSTDETARIWTAEGVAERVLSGHTDDVLWASWSPDSKRVVTASRDGTARIYHADGSGNPIVLNGSKRPLTCVAWSPKGDRIAVASEDGAARIYRGDGAGEPIALEGHTDACTFVAWSPDGERVALASMDETASIHRADGTGKTIVLKGHTGGVKHIAWRPDGQYVATGSKDEEAHIYRADGEGAPIVLTRHSNTVNWVEWSPKGDLLVTASADSTAVLWRVVTDGSGAITKLEEGAVMTQHATAITMALFSPDGESIVTTSNDGRAMAFLASDPKQFVNLVGHEGPVVAASWQPNGRSLVTASADGNAKLWQDRRRFTGWSLPNKDDPPATIVKHLEGATAECVPPEERQMHLGEPADKAKAAYDACERPYRGGAAGGPPKAP